MTLKVLLHAPTANALARARSNAKNLRASEPGAQCEIVVNAEGVAAALKTPDPATDDALRVCANTLHRIGEPAPAGVAVVDAAVAHLARRQRDGWIYIRA